MGLLLFLFVLAVAFTWMTVRSIRAGHGKFIFWLAWFLIGLSIMLSLQPPLPLFGRCLVQVWAYSIVVLPAWWSIQALRRASRRS
jgi:hypothetical protein